MSITPGQAIALGNLASPIRDKPITNAIIRKQNLDLAREEKKAKEVADQKKQEAELSKMIQFGKGGFSPHFQEQSTKIISQGVAEQLRAKQTGDVVGMNFSGQKLNRELENLKIQDDNYQNFIGLKKEGYLIPQELENALGERYSTGNKKLREYLDKNPEYKNIISIDDATGNYIYNPIKNIDLTKSFDSSIRDNESQMSQSKYIKDLDNNTALYELSLAPQQLTNIASGLASDPNFVVNAKIKYPDKFNKTLSEMATQFPEIPAQKLESAAAAKIFEEELTPRNKKVHFETKAQPQQTPAYNRNPDQLFIKTPIAIGGRSSFNEKYGTNYTEQQWAEIGGKESGKYHYVAVTPRSGVAATESLQLNISGKPFKPEGYYVKDGTVYASGAVNEPVKIGEDQYGDPKYQDKYVPKQGIRLDESNLAKAASHYHFDNVEKFKKWISSEGNKSESPSKNTVKELKGTSAQLEQAAKAKGLTKDQYKQRLIQAGYNVIEQ